MGGKLQPYTWTWSQSPHLISWLAWRELLCLLELPRRCLPGVRIVQLFLLFSVVPRLAFFGLSQTFVCLADVPSCQRPAVLLLGMPCQMGACLLTLYGGHRGKSTAAIDAVSGVGLPWPHSSRRDRNPRWSGAVHRPSSWSGVHHSFVTLGTALSATVQWPRVAPRGREPATSRPPTALLTCAVGRWGAPGHRRGLDEAARPRPSVGCVGGHAPCGGEGRGGTGWRTSRPAAGGTFGAPARPRMLGTSASRVRGWLPSPPPPAPAEERLSPPVAGRLAPPPPLPMCPASHSSPPSTCAGGAIRQKSSIHNTDMYSSTISRKPEHPA